jgi:hypothetical protein
VSIRPKRHRHRRGFISLAIVALFSGGLITTVIASTTAVAGASNGDFTIPLGGTATISGAGFSACDALDYGYVLNGVSTQVDSEDSGCGAESAASATIGPVAATSTLQIYLHDNYLGDTFLSDGNHALVSGQNPYTVDIADDGVGSCSTTCTRIPAEGGGNVTLKLTIAAPVVAVKPVSLISATAGTALTNATVATITDSYLAANAAEFSASISWGNGITSSGAVAGSDGNFSVTGSNTYSTKGSFPVSIDVTDVATGSSQIVATSASVADAALLGSAATVPPATVGVALTATVATFTYAITSTPSSNFTATISWGDGGTSAGTIGGSAGSYSVSGMHTYSADGTTANPVKVVIEDAMGSTVTVTDNDVTVADAVIACTTSTCSGTLTTPTVTVQTSTSGSGTGDIFVSADPDSGATSLNCGDSFRHGPKVITESDTFGQTSGSITTTITFPNKDGTAGKGLEGLLYAICFQAKSPFVDAFGKTTTLGILPVCNPFKPGSGPCVNWILPGAGGTIVEKLTYPVGDPRYG